MEIKNVDIIAIVVLFVGLIGVYEVWFGQNIVPTFVVIIITVIFVGSYGLVRIVQFKDRPGLNQTGVVRLLASLEIILMLYGQFTNNQATDTILVIALLGVLGINALSLLNER